MSMKNPHACLQCNKYLHRIQELEAAIGAALAEDHADAEVYAEVVPKMLSRALRCSPSRPDNVSSGSPPSDATEPREAPGAVAEAMTGVSPK